MPSAAFKRGQILQAVSVDVNDGAFVTFVIPPLTQIFSDVGAMHSVYEGVIHSMSFSASLLHAIPVAEAGRPFAHSWGYDASLSALLIPSADAISAPASVPALGLVLVGLLQAHRTLLKSLSSSLSSHLPLQAAAWQLCEHAWLRLFSALDARVGAARAYESLMHWDKLLHGRPSGSLLAEGRKLLFHGELSRKGARDIREIGRAHV